jgi:PAS domain S-box-containing protein
MAVIRVAPGYGPDLETCYIIRRAAPNALLVSIVVSITRTLFLALALNALPLYPAALRQFSEQKRAFESGRTTPLPGSQASILILSEPLDRRHFSDVTIQAAQDELMKGKYAKSNRHKLILSGILLSAIQGILIFGLLWQRAKRRRFEESLVERLAFEHLVNDLSMTFINQPEDQLDATVKTILGRIAEFLKIDRIAVFGFSHERTDCVLISSWRSDAFQTLTSTTNQFPWQTKRLLRGESVLVSDLNELPEEASGEKEELGRIGAISLAAVPLKAGNQFCGCISFVSTKRRVIWTEGLVNQLQILAEILANALMRKRAHDERFRQAAIVESSDDAIISKDLNRVILTWNAGAQRIFGFTQSEAVGHPIRLLIPPELFDEECSILQKLRAGARIEQYETLRVTKGGKKIDVSLTISAIRDSSGVLVGYSQIARDITERKTAEKELHDLSARLINAQEEERTHIARELHDDFSQRLALLSIGLGQLWKQLPEPDIGSRDQLQEMWTRIKEISSDLHRLSHQLHSSKLDLVGLVPAVMGLCQEIRQKHDIQVEFTKHHIPSVIPKEVALCLFRVTQAAISNVVKHSEAKRVRVELFGTNNEIHLQIADNGVGFDPVIQSAAAGIGLIGMRERLRLLDGELTVQSVSGAGSTIQAQVPLTALSHRGPG